MSFAERPSDSWTILSSSHGTHKVTWKWDSWDKVFSTWEQYGSCLKIKFDLLWLKILCFSHSHCLLQLKSLCHQHDLSHISDAKCLACCPVKFVCRQSYSYRMLKFYNGEIWHRYKGFGSAHRFSILLSQLPLSHSAEAAKVSFWILCCVLWPCHKWRRMLSSFSY